MRHLLALVVALVFSPALPGCGPQASDDASARSDGGRIGPDGRPPDAPDAGRDRHDAPTTADAARDTGMPDRPDVAPDSGAVEDTATTRPDTSTGRTPRRTSWPRGLAWVRTNPPFVSGLNVQMDGVPRPFVDAYYDHFGATAIHLWELGAPDRLGTWLSVPRSDHRWLTWLRADGRTWTNGKVAGGMAPGSPGRIGYQIGDEPRTWAEYEEMMQGAATVRAHDPDALVFLNMTFHAAELDRMMADQCNDPTVDVFSHDNYQLSQGGYEWLEYFRSWGLQCDRPYWRYINGFARPGEPFPEATDLRWHAFVGLVYGFTGHSWFLYQIGSSDDLLPAFFGSAGDVASARTDAFDVASDVNRQLVHYGRIVHRLTSTDVRYTSQSSLAQPTGTTPWAPGAGNDPYLVDVQVQGALLQEWLVGFFEDNYGERYVMLQNPNHESGSFPVGNDESATLTLTFDFSSAPARLDPTTVEHLDGETGQVSDVALAGATLEVTLPPGELFLFKYATGAPWDML